MNEKEIEEISWIYELQDTFTTLLTSNFWLTVQLKLWLIKAQNLSKIN